MGTPEVTAGRGGNCREDATVSVRFLRTALSFTGLGN